jgi:hypothetical protein
MFVIHTFTIKRMDSKMMSKLGIMVMCSNLYLVFAIKIIRSSSLVMLITIITTTVLIKVVIIFAASLS